MAGIIWFLVFLLGALVLAYQRVSLLTATLAYGGALLLYAFTGANLATMIVLWVVLAVLVLLNIDAFRIRFISRPFLRTYRRMLPSMSQTEKDALEAGTVWWDGELFTGGPDWEKLLSATPPRLTAEEQAFIDGPCEELCRMIDDWDITHRRADLPPHLWDFIKSKGFFAMIIPKKYGGLEFSAYAHSCVLVKLSSRSGVVASTVAVPNSLGPGELLLHYGTEEQRNHYLPRLARGEEVPCFALTGPRAGSDAASIPDTGIVCKGMYEGREIVGVRLNFSKRYITLAPVATVVGLAFKLFDPERLLGGDRTDYGITCALIPRHTPGVTIGRRHFPLNAPFQNGPIQGKDVFVPLDCLIGGHEDGGPRLAHARRAAVGRPLHFAALERNRRSESGSLRHRRVRAHPPAVQRSGRSVRRRRGSARAHDRHHLHHGRRALGHGRRDRRRREAVRAFGDAEVSPHRVRPQRRQRRHGYPRRQGHHARPPQLPGARLRPGAGRDHGRRREHADAQPDHLRPGRDPLPSVRPARNERGARERQAQGPQGIRRGAVRPHRLHDQQRGALADHGADARALLARARRSARPSASISTSTASARRSRSPPTWQCSRSAAI